MDNTKNNERVYHAIHNSCIPLLYGTPRRVRRVARYLYRTFGIISYVLHAKNSQKPTFFQSLIDFSFRHYLRPIPCMVTSPEFLADTTIRFFNGTDPNAIPVLIDCTDESILLSDDAIHTTLACHCFVATHENYHEIPPFCYLDEVKRYAR